MDLDGSAKILTIDDEYVLRQSIVAYLEDSGFTVFEAENGKVGLEVFAESKPDLVLTDLQMPEMSGLEFLAEIHEMSPETPVIVISGAGGMNDVIEALRLGAWDYLTKPVTDLAVLEHAICKALERARLVEENKSYALKLQRNLQILEEDQQAGRNVQMKLLPEQNMEVGDYIFNHRVIPSLYLSGDFIDYFKISEEYYAFYLADVSGHGASSAFVTVLLKSLIQQVLSRYQVHGDQTILKPECLMEELSAEVHSASLGKYMTIVYAVLNVSTHECTYGVGGHYPSPILLEPGGGVKYLEGGGFPIGIMKSAQYTSSKLTIPEDGHLIIFSDGIMEIFMPERNMSEKEAGLLQVVGASNGEIESIILGCEINTEDDIEQPDDITTLVISRV